MTKQLEPILAELEAEAATTKRVLDRVPGDKLAWRPHEHSMTMGELAMHIAMTPGVIARMAQTDQFEIDPARIGPPQPVGTDEILRAHDASVTDATAYVKGLSDETAMALWSLRVQGKTLLTMPRTALMRTLMLNHWYHHRGQLSVYLRLAGVAVPSIYGPSHDESPFALASEVGATA